MGQSKRQWPASSNTMATIHTWTNPSVLDFAQGQDPVQMMERAARELALKAMDNGWSGPPFDPLSLAERQGITLGSPNSHSMRILYR